MNERISKILKNKNLSASKFADQIGVQRSGISHIISGRNKPSLDFIQKILTKFPDIDPDWLISGIGEMYRTEEQNNLTRDLFDAPPKESYTENSKHIHTDKEDESGKKKIKSSEESKMKSPEMPSDIEKIVIFYKNKTFKEYLPGQ